MIVIIDYLIVFLVAIIAILLPDMYAVYSGGAFRCGLNMRNRGRNNLLDSPFYY